MSVKLYTFIELCKVYGVHRQCLEVNAWMDFATKHIGHINGPWDSAFFLKSQTVAYSRDAKISHKLHELVHVITHPPGNFEVDAVPEDLLLLQFERALARVCVEARQDFADLIDYQLGTTAPNVVGGDDHLGKNHNYHRTFEWRRGFAFARRLGLLNITGRPTLKPAVWTPELIGEYSFWIRGA